MTFERARLKVLWAEHGDVFLFFIVLVGTHFVWKYSVVGNENESVIMLFNTYDISEPCNRMACFVAKVCERLMHLFGSDIKLYPDNFMLFPNGNGTHIVWGCTGVKQSVIFLCIMLFSRGLWQRKLWFIPMGIVLCLGINVVRICLINAVVETHPEWFHVLHAYVFKYLYYGLIFLMWMWWTERLSGYKRSPTIIVPE